jgi:hypothetical protein
MSNPKTITFIPSRSSPKSSGRACLCRDKDTYSRKCCKGEIMNQGIGSIYRQG